MLSLKGGAEMSIVASRWAITQELKSLGTSEVKPSPAEPWKFGEVAEFDGHQLIDSERTLSYAEGARIVVKGSHAIAGPGKVTINVYSGVGDTADTLIASYGPYGAAALGGVEFLALPPGSYSGNVFQVGLKADQAAGTAFTAGSIDIYPEFD